MQKICNALLCAVMFLVVMAIPRLGFADGDKGDANKVNHIIVIMQENHSFDNYFGALAYAPGSPYHRGLFGCRDGDHSCVDGLTCVPDKNGDLHCYNANRDDDGSLVSSFDDSRRCASPWMFVAVTRTISSVISSERSSASRFFCSLAHGDCGP